MTESAQTKVAHGTFCWNELMTRDPAAAKTFFTKLLGWTATDMDMGPMGTYTVFKCGDECAETQVAGMMEMKGAEFEGMSPTWMSYIHVDDVDATAKKAESLGGTICQPPTDIPNVGRIAMINDPSGATLGLFKMT